MKCCLCGKEIESKDKYSYGNNPYPVCTIENARCCDECDKKIVSPYRYFSMTFKENYDVFVRSLENL